MANPQTMTELTPQTPIPSTSSQMAETHISSVSAVATANAIHQLRHDRRVSMGAQTRPVISSRVCVPVPSQRAASTAVTLIRSGLPVADWGCKLWRDRWFAALYRDVPEARSAGDP